MDGVTTAPTLAIPGYVQSWYDALPARSLAAEIGDPARAAFFSTDMIVGFCSKGALASERVGAIVPALVDLCQRTYDVGVRDFVFTQDTHPPDAPEFAAWPVHCVRGTAESEMIPELKALPFAALFTVFEKNSLHPALGTGFDAWLAEHPNLRTAIVVGNCTDLCVYQLALHLRLTHNARNVPDVRVIVPADTVNTYDLPPETAREIGAMPHPGEFFHQVFLYHMALNGIEVVRALS
jgi:nicotinamidase-related amidase